MSNDFHARGLGRRAMLSSLGAGFGWLASSDLLAAASAAAPSRRQHARRVIFLFMSGGVSHVDSFDPKPLLQRHAGQPMPVTVARTQFDKVGTVMPSPWRFSGRGQCGLEVSDLFPCIAEQADRLAVIRSMTSGFSEHAQANLFLHTGVPFLGFPSAGAWASYGLGRESENLPGYVVLTSAKAGVPHGGAGCYGSGFLPGHTAGTQIACDVTPAFADLAPWESENRQRHRCDFVNRMNSGFHDRIGSDAGLEASLETLETACRMQLAVPEVLSLAGETKATLQLYGIDSPDPLEAAYGRQCLLARRLAERGVRFIQLSCLSSFIGDGNAANPWDQHSDLERGHTAMARQVDRPIAGLLADLASRGLLEDTLVVWAGEFGRTPFSQGSDGRDHNPFGFSIWLAGGGVRGGICHGATDELGYRAVDAACTVYDLWATVLHLLGVDHRRLTYRHGGRDVRLTDVHGEVIREVIA
jgi:hypothetical protein